MVTLCNSEDELAVILSHELAHIIFPGNAHAPGVPVEMVTLCNSEDELAVILSHELAHIKAGHVNNPFIDEK
jgi:predicted Zn-dependent protease